MTLALYSKIPSGLLLSPYGIKVDDGKREILKNFLSGSGLQNDYTIIYVHDSLQYILIAVGGLLKEINVSTEKFKEKENSYFNYIANK